MDSKNLVLNLLGTDTNIQINKKLLLTLGFEESFFLSYLIDQYRYLERVEKLREDSSFYASNMDISLYTTLSDSQILKLKKSGVEKGLFKVTLEDSRTKTFYQLNFNKILELIGTDKSNLELAYKNIFNNENINFELNAFEDIEEIKKFTVKELRYYCKKNNIKYSGNDKKDILIGKIVKEKNPLLFSTSHFSKVNEITTTSEQKIRPLRENNTSKESVNENAFTVNEISVTNQEHINQEKISCHERDSEIENLFHGLGINFTNANLNSTNIILKKLKNDKELLKKYLQRLFDNISKSSFKVNNFSALFSSKLKAPDEVLIKSLLLEKDKKIEKENEIKLQENKKIQDEIKRKETLKSQEEMNLIINKLDNLEVEKKEKIIAKAYTEAIKNNPEMKETLDNTKTMSEKFYCRMLSKEIKKIFVEQHIEINFLNAFVS